MQSGDKLDNSGQGPLKVPGFGKIPLDFDLREEGQFAHGIGSMKRFPAVTARELAMTEAMNMLTDKTDWFIHISDSDFVSAWRDECFARYHLMNDRAWDWCVAELRDKAEAYKDRGFVRVLDTGSGICKSDSLVSNDLRDCVKAAVADLYENKAQDPAEVGGTSKCEIINVVDPFMHPLVFGRTRVMVNGGRVARDEPFISKKRTKRAPKPLDLRHSFDDTRRILRTGPRTREDKKELEPQLPFYHYSATFQKLPCEVEFVDDTSNDISITSYINNLNPAENKSLYSCIEKLITCAIPPWNECLIRQGKRDYLQHGSTPMRIVSFQLQWEDSLPEWALSFHEPISEWHPPRWGPDQKLLSELDIAPPDDETWRLAEDYLKLPCPDSSPARPLRKNWKRDVWRRLLLKAVERHHVKHPDPGEAFSYDDWHACRYSEKAVVDRPSYMGPQVPPGIPPTHHHPPIHLAESFRKSGLQVIVQIGGIELTPSNPKHAEAEWRLQGHANEHIVGVCMYAFDVSNVTQGQVSFRQEFNIYHVLANCSNGADIIGSAEEIEGLAELYGINGGDIHYESRLCPSSDRGNFQQVGVVNLPEGRLITFPNVMEHRMEAMELIDPTKPGHHRCLTLLLVDPHYRICSTRNVPAQQKDWWAQKVTPLLVRKGLPREVAEMVVLECDDKWLMKRGTNGAEGYRQQMLNELECIHWVRYYQMELPPWY